jgi:hypothetical protein
MERKFRPVPLRLRQNRYGAPYRGELRFYGLVETLKGNRKHVSFQVHVSPRLLTNRQRLSELIRALCNAIKYQKKIPVHIQRQSFSSFQELFNRTRWVEIKKLLDYKAGMRYER